MSEYVSRRFLNGADSQFTGTVHAYFGKAEWKPEVDHGFFAVGDCNVIARLHAENQDKTLFANKLRILAEEANRFADWLEKAV